MKWWWFFISAQLAVSQWYLCDTRWYIDRNRSCWFTLAKSVRP